jgi:TonB family protein
MTTRPLATLVILAAALVATAVPRAQSPPQVPAQAAAQQPPAQQPPAQQPPGTPPPPDAQSPPADTVYAIGRGGVMPPRVQRETRPAYTAGAMRNRIQGRVRLQGVVERDGTVSGVSVIESLDAQFGLDQAAVDAFKQWRFQPGTLADGTPVRVLVNVDMTFTLRDESTPQAWPEGFGDATTLPGAVEETADAQDLRLKLSRPANWTIRREGPPGEWIGLQSADKTASLAVIRPETATSELRRTASEPQVQELVDRMRRLHTAANVESLATGQVQASPDVLWVWSVFRIPDVSSLPGASPTDFSEARSWVFARTVGNRLILVQCIALLPSGLDSANLAARAARAAAEFAPSVRSISVDTIAK